jgi:3-hydroxyacyl-[acyl-carrier-protein] dehydratase
MTEWKTGVIKVPDNHATAAGHFPGRPVVPGALLLDEVVARLGLSGALTVRSVKFLAPVAHGDALDLRWRMDDDGLCRFEIRRADDAAPVLTGTLAGDP